MKNYKQVRKLSALVMRQTDDEKKTNIVVRRYSLSSCERLESNVGNPQKPELADERK